MHLPMDAPISPARARLERIGTRRHSGEPVATCVDGRQIISNSEHRKSTPDEDQARRDAVVNSALRCKFKKPFRRIVAAQTAGRGEKLTTVKAESLRLNPQ